MAHAYNSSTLGGRSPEIRSSRPAWPTWWNPVSTKNTKINWVWWHVPVIPATWKAEAEKLLEPGRWRLWWAETVPLHSRDKSKKLHLKKKIFFPCRTINFESASNILSFVLLYHETFPDFCYYKACDGITSSGHFHSFHPKVPRLCQPAFTKCLWLCM